MRTIYFSPHLDDAVLSAGGLIHEQTRAGMPVEIWSFMAGTPDDPEVPDFARTMHKIWGFQSAEEAIRLRRQEDRAATGVVGAKPVHFDFLDCIYRRGKDGKALYNAAFLPMHPEDADLPAQVAQAMIAWLRPDDKVVCLLGIGNHVDHLIVRKAAEMLHRPLIYIPDIPYSLKHPEDLPAKTAGMQATLQPVSDAALGVWIKAIQCYASQVDSVFGGLQAMQIQMRSYWSEQSGVRFWEPCSQAT